MDENNRGLEIVRYNNNQGGGVEQPGGRLEKLKIVVSFIYLCEQ